MIPPLYDRV
jgi:hypothetical protein